MGGKERRDEDRSGLGGEVQKRRQKRVSSCLWAVGRRMRWRVLGLIIKTAGIGLFVGSPKKLTLRSNGYMGTEVGRQEKRGREGGGEEGGGGLAVGAWVWRGKGGLD